jgi:aspartyl-tRNA(Asn)/glutamyl-tRNA(Gln) amidotransferase subunit B
MVEMKFDKDIIIGLEIHVELDTETKLFCSCPTKAEQPNTATCEICLGMPGSKPVVNKKAIEYALKLAMALNCSIAPELIFSRKTYFYPDMSKNYQITQYEMPLGSEGFIELAEGKKIGVTRVHLEEDPASLTHLGSMETSPFVLVDYNRSGRPLCEIVTKPEIYSPQEAREFMKQLITILQSLKIFNIKTRIIKADANVSVKESGYVRAEIKNITGFKEIERALTYEIERQKKEILEGKGIVQETRGWDANLGITKSLRSKETEEDYGYIFDPDLVAIDITKEMAEKAKKSLPELPNQKLKRYIEKLKINKTDAQVISSDFVLSEMFDRLVNAKVDASLSADWIRRELPRVANYNKKEVEELLSEDKFEEHFIEIIELLGIKKITPAIAKDLLNKIADGRLKESPKKYVEKEKLSTVSDSSEIKKFCEEAIKENPKAVEDYKKGEMNALNFLIGQVMRKSKGKANADEVKKIIEKII